MVKYNFSSLMSLRRFQIKILLKCTYYYKYRSLSICVCVCIIINCTGYYVILPQIFERASPTKWGARLVVIDYHNLSPVSPHVFISIVSFGITNFSFTFIFYNGIFNMYDDYNGESRVWVLNYIYGLLPYLPFC